MTEQEWAKHSAEQRVMVAEARIAALEAGLSEACDLIESLFRSLHLSDGRRHRLIAEADLPRLRALLREKE